MRRYRSAERRRRRTAFTASLCAHGAALAWVALGPAMPPPAQSLYDREIRPYHGQIIWYKLSERLPEVAPARAAAPPRPAPPRPLPARRKFDQSVVAGTHESAKPPQLILSPAPEITLPKPLPLPNLVAVAPKVPPVRLYAPPPDEVKPVAPPPTLPDAPKVTRALEVKPLPVDLKATIPLRRYTPPKQPKLPQPEAPKPLPDAPASSMSAALLEAESALPKVLRGYVPPPRRPVARPKPQQIAEQPPSTPDVAGGAPNANTLAIVGLEPAKSVEAPAPPGSHTAEFSAGPKAQPKGSEAPAGDAMLEIPSLTVRGGAKEDKPVLVAGVAPTSAAGLAAAMRMARNAASPGGPPRLPGGAADPPDPRLRGRQVYAMAIQMPNVTSHSGSWLVWFARHEQAPGEPPLDIQPPLPLRKVDPKYGVDAMQERVEGKVRLWAVIGKDGRPGSISLAQHLDDRLDRSAMEALSKWLFQPAQYKGMPVEVDALFEIPFYLAPKTER